MILISEPNELHININSFEEYLVNGSDDEKKKIRSLIKRGRCLVAYTVNNNISFAPSRFLGYLANYLDKHFKSETKNGTETNLALNKVLKQKLIQSADLENKYVQYCQSMNIEPTKYEYRKYWALDIEKEFDNNKQLVCKKPEGNLVERIHKIRERNSKVVSVAKYNFKLKNGHLFCEACNFDFEKKYGDLGADFIEAHHTIPVSQMKENHITSSEDFILLCSNCHRMIHKKDPWLSMDKLRKLIN